MYEQPSAFIKSTDAEATAFAQPHATTKAQTPVREHSQRFAAKNPVRCMAHCFLALFCSVSSNFALTAAVEPQNPVEAETEDAAKALADAKLAQLYLREDVRAYLDNIAAIEQTEGAYALDLTEPLLSAGLALQRYGAHEQAVGMFKRGVHLTRINEGLYSTRQIALLQGEIASHVALGAYEDADERQGYLHRVQSRTLSDTSRGEAYMQYARWQRQAYEAGIGEEPVERLLLMRNLYRLAYAEYLDSEGDESPKLLPPLYGMLRTEYLFTGFVGETTSQNYRTQVYSSEASQQIAYRGQTYKEGKVVLQTILDVTTAQPQATLADRAKVGRMLGDWQLWNSRRSDAFKTYAAIDRELALQEDAQELRQQLFGLPEPLPTLEGVRALPIPGEEQTGHMLLEFGVNDRGRVQDLVRLDEYPKNDEIAGKIMRRIRQTLFRPRISDGMPVDTEGLRWAYDTSYW